jgi:hypothetical protein
MKNQTTSWRSTRMAACALVSGILLASSIQSWGQTAEIERLLAEGKGRQIEAQRLL